MLNTGNSNKYDLSGMQFSTHDQDNDNKSPENCASMFKAGWWHNFCYNACLNGPWAPGNWPWPWYPTIISGADIKETAMLIKAH
jgi:hypothetical protein